MGVLDRLPENAFRESIASQRQDMSQLKGSFQRFGSRSVKTHRVFSDSEYDLLHPATSPGAPTVVHEVEVEFLPDDKRFGGAFCYRLMAKAVDSSSTGYQITTLDRKRTTDGRQVWTYLYQTFGGMGEWKVKFYFFTTGSGTFTVNVIT